MNKDKKLRILTWHIHGSYLYYLTQTSCTFYLPHKYNNEEGYGARTHSFNWGENVISVPAEMVRELEFDCILFQSKQNYLSDQYEILSDTQRLLPKIYLEHDPPREHPTNTNHIVDDPSITLVHVTHYNNLMWNNNNTPTTVIEHGVCHDPEVMYTGELEKGIAVLNGLSKRGRRLGLDVFEKIREKIPIDIIGIDAESIGGLGEIRHAELPKFLARYRFYLHPVRYTSLGLSVCEAMMVGLPIIGLATTELPTIIENDQSGYIHCDIDWLISKMQRLLHQPQRAKLLGEQAQEIAIKRFHIERFREDWHHLFKNVVHQHNSITT